MSRPEASEYPPFYHTYVTLVPETNIKQAFIQSVIQLRQQLSLISNEKAGYAYSPGKWTIRQLLQHTIDTERIFSYRALCISRGEKKSLPGFDENAFAEVAEASNRHLTDLKEEMLCVRQSSVLLFQSFTDDMLRTSGLVNNNPVTVLAIGFMIIGHWRHHAGILRERYAIDE